MNMLVVDYYFTTLDKIMGEYDNYKVTHKFRIEVHPSSDELIDNMDIFVSKKEFPVGLKPTEHDLVFFTEKNRFYEVKKAEEFGNIWTISINILKQKK